MSHEILFVIAIVWLLIRRTDAFGKFQLVLVDLILPDKE
jgi:hypothetical protein